MITSKPKRSTLASLFLFLAIVFFVILYNYKIYHESGFTSNLNLIIIAFLFPIGVGICLKILGGYKVIFVGKEKFKVLFPLRFWGYEFKVKEVDYWKENKVKTFNSTFVELEIASQHGRKIKLSRQEHSEYDKILSYLNRKCRNKKRS